MNGSRPVLLCQTMLTYERKTLVLSAAMLFLTNCGSSQDGASSKAVLAGTGGDSTTTSTSISTSTGGIGSISSSSPSDGGSGGSGGVVGNTGGVVGNTGGVVGNTGGVVSSLGGSQALGGSRATGGSKTIVTGGSTGTTPRTGGAGALTGGAGGAVTGGSQAITGGSAGAGAVYTLPSNRITKWQPGVTYNGGIPNRTTSCATLKPSGGDDAPAIQKAVDNCPAEQVVNLAAGTFHFNSDGVFVTRSNITIRGAGPGKTIISTTQDISIIFVGTLWYTWVKQTAFTADAVKGQYSVTLASNPGLTPGEIVHVNETYDSALTWYNMDQGQNGDYQGWGEGRKGPQAQSRPIGQAMEVASISGNTVTFTTPFHITFRTSHAAHLARLGDNGDTVVAPKQVTKVGIEELTLDGGGGGDQGGNLRMAGASYCWAKHIESTRSQSSAFAFDGSFRCELRDSYIHSTQNPSPGGGGYGIVVDSYAADNLLENNISWNFNKVMVMRSSGGGNVIGYNYMTDGWGEGYPTLPEVGINASHMATPHFELFEGNESHNFASDTTWGNTINITIFRNHLTGLRRSYTPLKLSDQGNRRCAEINQSDFNFSFVGNVLGYSGMPLNAAMAGGNSGQKSWQYEASEDNDTDARMWQLMHADAAAQATLLRMGNFDWVTKTQKWPGLGGIGTADNPPNPLPTIADSLYITTKPDFMGSNPWPWVDPTNGTTYVLPARARFDANTPNTL